MPSGDDSGVGTLSPDDAFAALGDETRVDILRTLGEADGPLAFTDLRTRVGVADSGQFNYHLDRLLGHFVRKDPEGYRLHRAGRRVVEAVLSGAVTDAPVVEPTRVAQPCHYCGAETVVGFHQDRVYRYCTACPGRDEDPSGLGDVPDLPEEGFLGYLPLPPAGVAGRSATEAFAAAWTWANLEFLAEASGICSRCSAALSTSVSVCRDHDGAGGLCDRCGERHAVTFHADCTNCINDLHGPFVFRLVADTHMLEFLTDHGLNPVAPSPAAIREVDRLHMDYDEEVVSVDPFEARFTFRVDGETLTLTVDDELAVVDATRKE